MTVQEAARVQPGVVAGQRSAPRPPVGVRQDIQGLRALAVGCVVLSHAGVPGTAGGFVGVDVFFVLSGFLITGILVRDAASTGRVSLADFYARRARRILPAAFLVMIATGAASLTLLDHVRSEQVLRDTLWTALFGANINFSRIGSDYFAQDTAPSPMQQYWSLAVEEQFYVVWPLLLGVVVLAHRRWRAAGHSPRGDTSTPVGGMALPIVLALLIAASFAWSVLQTDSHPAAAYFSTTARGWELGAGALVALLPGLRGLSDRAKTALGWSGIAGILAAVISYGQETPFPGIAAALPVLGTVAVLCGGLSGAPALGPVAVLRLRPLQYLGDISYSVYLWHWPVLVISAAWVGRELTTVVNMALCSGAVALAALTYHWVENPLRRSDSVWKDRDNALMLWPVTATVVVVSCAAGLAHTQAVARAEVASSARVLSELAGAPPSGGTVRPDAAAAGTGALDSGTPGLGAPEASVRVAVQEAVAAAEANAPLPDLAQPVASLPKDRFQLGRCGAYERVTSDICRYGAVGSARTLVVFGNSHAEMWLPAINQAALKSGVAVVPFVKPGCSLNEDAVVQGGECAEWYAWAKVEIARIRPAYIALVNTVDGNVEQIRIATDRVLSDLEAMTAEPLRVLGDVPRLQRAPADCLLARDATQQTCLSLTPDGSRDVEPALQWVVEQHEARFVRTAPWLCDGLRCPVVVGGVVTYRDTGHLTATYVTRLGSVMAQALDLASA